MLEAYFGESGLGYSLCRVHMGSCDYCQASYTEADTPADWSLQHFNISHDEMLLLPLLRRALATRVSPPAALLPPSTSRNRGTIMGISRCAAGELAWLCVCLAGLTVVAAGMAEDKW